MRIILLILLFGFGSIGTANAQQFSLNKSKFQQCVNKVKPGKKTFGDIGDNCGVPMIERECRYGGKNANTFYSECPEDLVRQMGRWIKQESAVLRKAGGKKAKEAKKLTGAVGDASNFCQKTNDTGRKMDRMNIEYCRAIVLAQTYGMLHFFNTKLK